MTLISTACLIYSRLFLLLSPVHTHFCCKIWRHVSSNVFFENSKMFRHTSTMPVVLYQQQLYWKRSNSEPKTNILINPLHWQKDISFRFPEKKKEEKKIPTKKVLKKTISSSLLSQSFVSHNGKFISKVTLGKSTSIRHKLLNSIQNDTDILKTLSKN